MMKKSVCFALFALALLISIVAAQDYSMDITINPPTGDNVTYAVILLSDSAPFSASLPVTISDVNNKKVFNYTVDSNKDNLFQIEKDFPSGLWQISASYQNKSVKRFFSVSERQEAQFSIENDNLKIINTGNVQYSKMADIIIGNKDVQQMLSIPAGGNKNIKLVAPDGKYNIQVLVDGVTMISKQDVSLTGTGQVIGALDQQLVDSQPVLGSARDVKGESIFSSRNFSISVIFISAVFGLFVLLLIERTMRNKRAAQAKDMINLH